MKKLILLLMVMCLVSVASAASVWNPAANGIVPPAVGNWNDPCNWTNGIPDAVEKAVFNVPNAAECQVSDAQSGAQVVQGDGNDGGVLRILSGGTLTTKAGAWSAVGYNNTAHAIVDAGGTYTFSQHAWIGLNDGAVGTLDISGTVNVGSMLGLGWSDDVLGTSQGFVNVLDGGLLALTNIHSDGSTSIKHGSALDIAIGGQVTLPGDFVGVAEAYIAAGLITGPNASANLWMNPGSTTIIPEPATLSLLGLGALALIRRKK